MHEEIISDDCCIYAIGIAIKLYDDKKFTYKQLSIMKQENIQEAIQDKKFSKRDILNIVCQRCGYCFKFRGMRSNDCTKCPCQAGNTSCLNAEYTEFVNILEACGRFQRKKALTAHNKWLKSIGLMIPAFKLKLYKAGINSRYGTMGVRKSEITKILK